MSINVSSTVQLVHLFQQMKEQAEVMSVQYPQNQIQNCKNSMTGIMIVEMKVCIAYLINFDSLHPLFQ